MNPKHTPKPTTIKEGPALISNSEISIPYSLAESVAMYFIACAEQTKYWQEKRRCFDRHILPALGEATPVSAITSEQLADVISGRRVQGHTDAARVLHITLNQYFRWCREQGHVHRNPMRDLPTPGQSKQRERLLSDAELARFWLATLDRPTSGSFYRLLALTLQERHIVAAMQWDDLDLEGMLWTISTEAGGVRHVPLVPTAVAEIRAMPKTDGCPYVFASGEGVVLWAPPGGFAREKKRLDALIRPSANWHLNDLRSTAAAFFARSSVAPDVVRTLLGQKRLESRFPVSLPDLASALRVWEEKFIRRVEVQTTLKGEPLNSEDALSAKNRRPAPGRKLDT